MQTNNCSDISSSFKKISAFSRQPTFLYLWQGTPAFHIFTFLFFFFSSFFFVWVTPRRFHCRVNQAETPIHQTGMWVLSLLTGRIRRKKKPVSYFSSVWASLQGFIPSPGHPIFHTGLRPRGDSRIPPGLAQSPLMEPEVERPCTQQQNLKITTWALRT